MSVSDALCRHIIAVTNRRLCQRPFLEQLERVCSVRPAGVILREKDLTEAQYQTLAEKVLALCRRYDVPCILHGFPEAARRLGVQSVQLPLWQLEAAGGRPGLVGLGQIGASVHSVQEALRAEALGADSVTAGHIYETSCKEGLPPRGTEFLWAVCSAVRIPVYAIGGIRLEENQIRAVLGCGAAGVCIMSGMMAL